MMAKSTHTQNWLSATITYCSSEHLVISYTKGRGLHTFIHNFYWKTKNNENLLKM